MTSKERVKAIFDFKIPDRVALYDLLPEDTYNKCDLDINVINDIKNIGMEESHSFDMLPLMDPFEDLTNAFGLEKLLEKVGKEPDEVSYELQKSSAKMLKRAGEIIDRAKKLPDGIWLWADMAYNKSAFFSLEFYEKHLFPLHKNICSYFAERGLPVVMHSDGNLNCMMGYLIDAGFKGLHPIESAAGMDIESLKKEYSGKIVLFANFSVDLLREEDEDNIFARIEEKLDIAMKDGAYVFGFDSPLTTEISPEKYRRVLNFVKEHGDYGRAAIHKQERAVK